MSWFRRRLPDDPAARAYLEATRRRPGRGTAVSELRIVSVDVETSGMKVGRDHLLSVGGIEIADGVAEVSTAFGWYVRQPAADVTEATYVHGILPADSAAGAPEEEVLRSLLGRLSGSVIVGHHVGFDAAVLEEALRRRFGVRLVNPLVDTANLATLTIEAFYRAGYPGQRPPSLEEVCIHCGIPMTDRHTATGDAFTTATLFLHLTALLRRRLGRAPVWGDLPARKR